MDKTVSDKLGVKEGMSAYFHNPPDLFNEIVGLPSIEIRSGLKGEFDYIHTFAGTQKELHDQFAKLKTHLKTSGMLWVSWPKSGQNGTDLNIKKVIEIGYDHGLVESKAISINSIWSALKFTHPIPGKVYNNSYGKLK